MASVAAPGRFKVQMRCTDTNCDVIHSGAKGWGFTSSDGDEAVLEGQRVQPEKKSAERAKRCEWVTSAESSVPPCALDSADETHSPGQMSFRHFWAAIDLISDAPPPLCRHRAGGDRAHPRVHGVRLLHLQLAIESLQAVSSPIADGRAGIWQSCMLKSVSGQMPTRLVHRDELVECLSVCPLASCDELALRCPSAPC